ncbi:MAG: 5' nucleotidase, NT5C type [Actinomycetota bacterium]
MRLGIDLDGVVADFNTGWITRYNSDFGADVAFDAVRSWDAIPSLTHFRHMGEFWRWARDHGGHSLFRHLETYDGAVEALGVLAELGHSIVVVTTKPGWAVHDTFEWIAENRIPTREVHILDRKWEVDCDIYLEDAPHNLMRLVRHRPERIVVRYVRPWNQPVEGVRDVEDWETFVKLVDSVDR